MSELDGWSPPECWPDELPALGKLIYLAGPMTSIAMDGDDDKMSMTHNGHARLMGLAHDASGIEGVLLEQGWYSFDPYSSVHNSRNFDIDPELWYEMDRCWIFVMWMVVEMGAFEDCAILLLPGWERSKGAKGEKAFAEQLGIDVYEWIPETQRMVLFSGMDN
jgi:hypothetical protein